MPRYIADSYPEIREVLASEYCDLPPENVEAIVRQTFGEASPEDVENFFKSLKKIGRAVGSVASKALPIVAPVAGTFFGPLGTMAGGALGKLAGAALGKAVGGGAARGAVSGISHAAGRLAGQGMRGMGPALTGGTPATAQLLGIMNRPEVMRALMSMMMGQAGRKHVPVGGTPVPVGAFANLIGNLANQVAAEQNAYTYSDGEAVPEYLLDSRGEFLVDPAVPDQRAALLLEMLLQTAPACDETDESDESDLADWEDQATSDDAMYDSMELAELYAEDWEDD